MKNLGLLLVLAGAFVVGLALIMSTTAPVSVGYGQEVHNIGLIHQRELTFLGGCTLAVIGTVVLVGGIILERLALAQVASPEHSPTAYDAAAPRWTASTTPEKFGSPVRVLVGLTAMILTPVVVILALIYVF